MTLSAEVMEIDRNSLSENTIFLRIPWIAQAVGLPCRMASPCEACVDGRVARGVRCAVVMSSVSPKWRKLFASSWDMFLLGGGEQKNV